MESPEVVEYLARLPRADRRALWEEAHRRAVEVQREILNWEYRLHLPAEPLPSRLAKHLMDLLGFSYSEAETLAHSILDGKVETVKSPVQLRLSEPDFQTFVGVDEVPVYGKHIPQGEPWSKK